MNVKELLNKLDLFWQYPAITEKTFYEQEKNNPSYIGFPWATVIDKRINFNVILMIILKYIIKNNKNKFYTCCQHISFRRLIPFWKKMGITTVYSPHKIIGEDNIDGIKIKPCPLYAVSVEDKKRNKSIKDKIEKTLLYSFVGSFSQYYISDIRKKIFELPKKKDIHIINRGAEWHFDPVVYSSKQNKNGELNLVNNHMKKTFEYNELLLKSKFTLAPSGTGPNSIRFWEALAVGSIPVLLADTLELPENKLWDKAIIRVKESDIEKIDDILRKIPEDEIKERSKNCIELYNFYKNNFANIKNEIIHYCCGSYDQGCYGGVARYDYHIKLAFPNRIFFEGPTEKTKMLNYLKECKKPIVITDNHLSCDIPNEYKCFLVHHGCALTTSERNPNWDKYWRDLCCNGQKKMLSYRNPNNTTVISISKGCTDDFTKFYPKLYPKFKRIDILHTSELDEDKFIKKFNETPNILGNWTSLKKGKLLLPKLKQFSTNFKFNQLNVIIKNGDINDFNKRKQDIYLQNDIFLQLSNSEGNSYASLDALLCGLVVVASDVGLFYKDIPEDCFVKLDWKRNNDVNYVKSKLEYAWKNRETIGKKGREWYLKNCNFIDWKKKMLDVINNKKINNKLIKLGTNYGVLVYTRKYSIK